MIEEIDRVGSVCPEHDQRTCTALVEVSMLSLISERDRVLVLLPASQPDGVGDLLLRALSGQGVHCSAIWPLPSAESLAKEVRNNSLTCLVGLPLHLPALAEALPKDSGVSNMLLCSDYAPAAVRERIEAAYGCKTFLHYGATETGLDGSITARLCDIRGQLKGCRLADGQELFRQDLDDALFGIKAILDFRARLDPGSPECLHIEYLAGRGYPAEAEIHEALLTVPAVREAVTAGRLVIGKGLPVSAFSATHTIKRSLLDRRF
ncbi:MAG: hypothetical protein Q8R88_10070 [Desulfoprunum sp.]|nr:hypothetical protein [Desulfoprunum sp.]